MAETKLSTIAVEPAAVVRLKWFRFSQNNSGGYFIQNEVVCEEVFIQAGSAQEAIAKARELFAPYSEYCECCGERWSYWMDDSEGHAEPMIYDEPITQLRGHRYRKEARLHHYDGRVQTYVFPEEPPIGQISIGPAHGGAEG